MNKVLTRHLGNMDQLAGVRLSRLESGNAAGKRIAEVYNAAGLRFTILPDKCMDLFDLSYKGVNIAFHSKNALSAAEPFYPVPSEFFGYWSGGMLATCGLSNIGGADESDPACVHPIHGRIGYQSADCFGYDCAWQGEDYVLTLEGRMRERASTDAVSNCAAASAQVSTQAKSRLPTRLRTVPTHRNLFFCSTISTSAIRCSARKACFSARLRRFGNSATLETQTTAP